MNHRMMMAGLCLSVGLSVSVPQRTQAQIVSVEQAMPDFTMTSVQGGEVTLSDLKGKRVLLIFPRGKVSDHWCQICHYQYMELVALERKLRLRERYGLEIVFVLPYSEEDAREWARIFPEQMEVIEGWKNPPDQENLSAGQRGWMETARTFFPETFTFEEGEDHLLFPIVIDTGANISKQLGLFRTEWGGSEVDQNVPTIFILDGEGTVQFKYHSQNTFDRPGSDYLLRVLETLASGF
ncbi:peroxiredoxin family protein [Candidatus Zixiibacteriota bacterium]